MPSHPSPTTASTINYPQSTPSLYIPRQLPDSSNSSSPLNDVLSTPRDDQRIDQGRGGRPVKGKTGGAKVTSRPSNIRVRDGRSSPFTNMREGDTTEELLDIDYIASELSLSSSRPPTLPSTINNKFSRSRLPILPPPPLRSNSVQPTNTLALAQAHGITADQFEEAKQQVMRFLRADNASTLAQSDDKGKGRAIISRSISRASSDTPSELLAPLSLSSRNTSPAGITADSNYATGSTSNFDASTSTSVRDLAMVSPQNSRGVKSRPSLEEMAERSARKQNPRSGASASKRDHDLREWAEAGGDQDYSSDELEDLPGDRRGHRQRYAADENKHCLPTFGDRQMASSSSFATTITTSPDTPFNSSPARSRYQGRSQPSPLHPTPKSARGMMERFMDDRAMAEGVELPIRVPASPAPPKGIRPSVLFSPDVARLLRNELEELGANSVLRPKRTVEYDDVEDADMVRVYLYRSNIRRFGVHLLIICFLYDQVTHLHSSPHRLVQSYDQEYTPGLSAVKRAREGANEGSDSLKRSRWASEDKRDRSPCPSTTPVSLRAQSFGDSSPPISERALSSTEGTGFGTISHPSITVHPHSAHDYQYQPTSSVTSSSPVSSMHSQSDYAPTPDRSLANQSYLTLSSYDANVPTLAIAPKQRKPSSKRSEYSIDNYQKPSWSYAALIGQAIFSTEDSKISLADVYTFIMASYPYYKKGDSGWQNSIRHNLSLNDCFIKTARGPNNPGKGCLWAVSPGCEEQFVDGGFVKKGAGHAKRAKKERKDALGGSKALTRSSKVRGDSIPRSEKESSPAGSNVSFLSSSPNGIDDQLRPYSTSRPPLLPAFSSSVHPPTLVRSPSVPIATASGQLVFSPAKTEIEDDGEEVVAKVVARAPRTKRRATSTNLVSSSTTAPSLIRRSTIAAVSTPASPPTSVYTRLAGPYRPIASSADNRRALALLASPEPAGIIAASSAAFGAAVPTQGSAHDVFSQAGQRAAFLPAFNVFPSVASHRTRQRTSEASDFALASPGYSRSPVSSMRNSAPEASLSMADPEKKRVASNDSSNSASGGSNSASPKSTTSNARPFGVRHHLPIVAALAEAASKTPPRLSAASSTHARARSNHHHFTPARAAGGPAMVGASPGWNSWGDNYGDLAAELENFGGAEGGGGLNVSPHTRSYAAW
jgi:hypothetical protein